MKMKSQNRIWIASTLLIFAFLGGCQQYEIAYVGQAQITEQKIKQPDVGPPFQYDKVIRDNTAFHFTAKNMEIGDIMDMEVEKSNKNDLTRLELFICGEKKFETTLSSALYFPDEIKFLNGAPETQTENSFYGVYVPRLIVEMMEKSKTQDKPICARIEYRYPWELSKTSNIVKLPDLN